MSDFQSLLDELETVLFNTAVSHYTIASSLCLYVYDFVVTFPAEVEYFWVCIVPPPGFPYMHDELLGNTLDIRKRLVLLESILHIPRGLLRGIQSVSVIVQKPNCLSLLFPQLRLTVSQRVACFAGQTVGIILSIVCVGGAQVVMQLRVHALYGQNRALKTIVSLLFFAAVSSELGIAIGKLATDHVYIQAIPFLIDPLELCVDTVPKFLIFYPLPMMLFDAILLILVVYKAYLIQVEETSATTENTWTSARLVRIMFRDSVIYFVCTVGVNLFNLLMWALGPYDLFTVGTAWGVTVPVMAASRILFSMRTAYHHPTSPTLDEDIGTEFQVAQRPHGSKGPTVWSGSSGYEESGVDRG
ncbi:hypothetical protein DFH07DRAFT_292712 [Mycena maculata]|uniref:DUF6533 domain-containing protein n=1 Tax=Mycena maculata TaxID=230809 RepID=A0AAD7JPG6_9AGAR|nr:hypothetical protein DFH07DRAFT_292712 [Mycena maculata]